MNQFYNAVSWAQNKSKQIKVRSRNALNEQNEQLSIRNIMTTKSATFSKWNCPLFC